MTYISLVPEAVYTFITNTGNVLTSGLLATSGVSSTWANLANCTGTADGAFSSIGTTGGSHSTKWPGLLFTFGSQGLALESQKIIGGEFLIRVSGTIQMTGGGLTGFLGIATSGHGTTVSMHRTGILTQPGLYTARIGASGIHWGNILLNSVQAGSFAAGLIFNPPIGASGSVFIDSLTVNLQYSTGVIPQYIQVNPNSYIDNPTYRRL